MSHLIATFHAIVGSRHELTGGQETALEAFYRRIEPRNQCNPGIGYTARARYWAGRHEGHA